MESSRQQPLPYIIESSQGKCTAAAGLDEVGAKLAVLYVVELAVLYVVKLAARVRCYTWVGVDVRAVS